MAATIELLETTGASWAGWQHGWVAPGGAVPPCRITGGRRFLTRRACRLGAGAGAGAGAGVAEGLLRQAVGLGLRVLLAPALLALSRPP